MNVKVKATFSKGRIETFYRFHFLKKSPYRIIELLLVIITFLISLLGITILENLYVFAIALVLGFVFIGTRNYRISTRIKKYLKVNSPDILPYYIIVKEDGIEYVRENESKLYKYNEIKEICEIDECFYIYVSEQKAIIMPKFLIEYEKRNKLREFFIGKSSNTLDSIEKKDNFQFRQYKFISTQDKEGVV